MSIDVGARLKHVRELHGLSQRELARRAGVTNGLISLIEHWVAYTKADVFPGGCFVAATSVEFGHRDGPVAESVQRLKREWLDLLEAELKTAGSKAPADDAFRIDSYLCMGNTRWQLYNDASEIDRAGRLALGVIRSDSAV
jgi:hypothetical protein